MWEWTQCNRNSNLIIGMKDHAAHEYKGRLNHCSFLAQMEHIKLCHKRFLFGTVHVVQGSPTGC